MQRTDLSSRKLNRPSFFAGGEPLVFAMVLMIGAASAVVIKEFTSRASGPALAAIEDKVTAQPQQAKLPPLKIADPLVEESADKLGEFQIQPAPTSPIANPSVATKAQDLSLRWFNGRPIRPAKTMTMLVTAYSPDERSCAGTADGITASLHQVNTNAHHLVAADSKVLPLGSMITIPGYDSGQVVPVLDRGGKIKGNHLDVLFPSNEEAVKWGARHIKVTVWEYADGQGAENWRAIRDSKN
jgi:3D (Asp-Asp-Asp) domain-containing protein